MSVKKMLVVPAEFFENYILRDKITEPPGITNQIRVEKEMKNLLKPKTSELEKEETAQLFATAAQDRTFIEQQRKRQLEIPPEIPPPILPLSESLPKKLAGERVRLRPRTKRQFMEGDEETDLSHVLDNFFKYDPLHANVFGKTAFDIPPAKKARKKIGPRALLGLSKESIQINRKTRSGKYASPKKELIKRTVEKEVKKRQPWEFEYEFD